MKFNREKVATIFKECGVSEGDTIFLHSDAIVTTELEGIDLNQKINTLFDGITDVIGVSGTLVIPTFTYSATKGEVYDVQNTKSEVGILTEYFRLKPGVKRSSNPIFSIAVFGANANAFVNSSASDCFGYDTCFGLIYKLNAWIFTLGCSFDRITFIHYVDQVAEVDYRYFKIFPATIVNQDSIQKFDISYFVRDLDRKTKAKMDKLKDNLCNQGKMIEIEMGRILLSGVRAHIFFNTALAMIREKSNVHIEEGYEF